MVSGEMLDSAGATWALCVMRTAGGNRSRASLLNSNKCAKQGNGRKGGLAHTMTLQGGVA
ncbi:hypothetical protein SAMN05421548_15116 [Paraburkholderia lycopersici]|uniref:Uncharacterized protein n=1 Tax=Paraburkholderia lycopersici TaxID=416944 RepID=A0A1G7D443_9BURK|nr:hypothetical protein SAMN05421548_15116 [Paraburkholderia lycopersici]